MPRLQANAASAPAGRTYDIQGSWTGGADSFADPWVLLESSYRQGINVINRGGKISPRPRYRLTRRFPEDDLPTAIGHPQGAGSFVDKAGNPWIVVAIGGILYGSTYPFSDWRRLSPDPSIILRADARQVFFCAGMKQAQTASSGVISLVDPTPMLFIQDNSGPCLIFDGQTLKKTVPSAPDYGPPIAGPMAWSGDRLWVADGSRLWPSNIAEPDKFTEAKQISGGGYASFRKDITALLQRPADSGLMAFTTDTTTVIQSAIRDRSVWATIPDFKKDIFDTIGCVASKSPRNHFGLSWWYSNAGLINLDDAYAGFRSSEIKPSDLPMERSKRFLSKDRTQVCSLAHGNFLLTAVPSGDKWNAAIWVVDQDSGAGRSWPGEWTGIKPVEFVTLQHRGISRSYAFCVSATDEKASELWEIFPDHCGRGGWGDETPPICQWESGLFRDGANGDPRKFAFADVETLDIVGDVNLRMSVAPSISPIYREIQTKLISAGASAFRLPDDPKLIPGGLIIDAQRPQSRNISSNELKGSQDPVANLDAVEFKNRQGAQAMIDRGFSLLLEWRGELSIRLARVFTDPTTQNYAGRKEVNEGKGTNPASDVSFVRPAYTSTTPNPISHTLSSSGGNPVGGGGTPPTDPSKVSMPTVSKPSGPGVNGTATIFCVTPGATIFYQINGGGFSVLGATGTTLSMTTASPQVYGFKAKAGTLIDSDITNYDNGPIGAVATPTITTVAVAGSPANIATLISTTPGASIYYSLNGAGFILAGLSGSLVTLQNTAPSVYTFKAKLTGWTDSAVITFDNTVNGTVATPTISKATVNGVAGVATVSSVTPSSFIYYSLNGGPFIFLGASGTPITLTNTLPSSYQFKAIASGFTDSSLLLYDNTALGTVATPTISKASASGVAGTAVINCATAGSNILSRYNGGAWTTLGPPGTLIAMDNATPSFYEFRATKTAFLDSGTSNYQNQVLGKVATPTFSKGTAPGHAGTATIVCATGGATIYKRLNGAAWTPYTGPFSMSASGVNDWESYATLAAYTDSDIAEYDNTIISGG